MALSLRTMVGLFLINSVHTQKIRKSNNSGEQKAGKCGNEIMDWCLLTAASFSMDSLFAHFPSSNWCAPTY